MVDKMEKINESTFMFKWLDETRIKISLIKSALAITLQHSANDPVCAASDAFLIAMFNKHMPKPDTSDTK